MEYKERSREKNTIVLEYRFGLDELEPYLKKAYQKKKGEFALPGFRRGKAPRKLLELHYGEDLFYDEALNNMIPDIYDESIEGLDLHPVAQPHFDMESIDKEEGAVLIGTVELFPEITLGEYKGMKVKEVSADVSDEEVDALIEAEREKNARLLPVEGRKTKEGDHVVFDFAGYLGDEPFEGGTAEDFELELGSGQFIPGFEEQMVEMDAGEEKDILVTFPEEYGGELSGKEARFHIHLKEIKEKELPELDDEFAKDVSEEETLEAYRESLRTQRLEEKQASAKEEMEKEAIELAAENMEVDIPQAMVENETDHMLRMMDFQMQMQGMNLQTYMEMLGTNIDDFRKSFHPEALKNVRTTLLLSEIAKKEAFEITQEEVDERLNELSSGDEKRLENLKKQHEKDDFSAIKEDISMRKARSLITDSMEASS